jgi:hemerythrin-like domain-containing protein
MAEHARLREFLLSIGRASASKGWRQPGPELAALKRLLEDLRAFDDSTHRPKGLTLFGTLRSRCPDPACQELLDEHEKQQAECSRLLDDALALLGEIDCGRTDAADECVQRLSEHRAALRAHLVQEDTALRAVALEHLTPDDWSAVVSSISNVVRSSQRAQ